MKKLMEEDEDRIVLGRVVVLDCFLKDKYIGYGDDLGLLR